MAAADLSALAAWLPVRTPPDILERVRTVQPLSPAERYNAQPGDLNEGDGVDCPLCLNRGTVAVEAEDGTLTVRECSCMAKRRSIRLLRASGLQDLVARCRFSNFEATDEWTTTAKRAAQSYIDSPPGAWMYISGPPGTGKTHLATAATRRMIGAGLTTRYMLWREDAPRLKALVNDAEAYDAEIRKYTSVQCLYIDDFLKQSGPPSSADLNLAFSILNNRYNSRTKRTILSSELPLREVQRLDPAIAGRIRERSRGYILEAPKNAIDRRNV